MSFKIECPHCGQPIEVDDELAETVALCPGCSQKFTVPAAPPPPVAKSISGDRVTTPASPRCDKGGAAEWEEYSGCPSWLNYFLCFFLAAIFALIGIIFPLFFFISAALVIGAFISRACTTYRVTNKRVICTSGLIITRTSEIRIRDIRAVEIVRGIFRTGLGFATAGTKGYDVRFRGMAYRDAEHVKNFIDSIISTGGLTEVR
ncbi:MAG: PH domain-containing protein [Victivallaceae bacterium]|nr:PH domain-containing protein [Victivallaceae bacterium]